MEDGSTLIMSLRDRAGETRTAEELRRSENRFRVAAEACSDLIWEACLPEDTLEYFGDVDGCLGYEPGAFPRTISGMMEAIHPDDRPALAEAIEKAAETGQYSPARYRVRRPDGGWTHLEERGRVTEMRDGEVFRLVGSATNVTERVAAEQELHCKLEELALIRVRLEAESAYLRDEIRSVHDFEGIVGRSDALLSVLHAADQVAATDASVLILGETGTGKELLARAIHARSGRRDRPLIKVDCCALPANLIESELFGHQKGAFTSALESRVGRFELADGATIFLDEIGELPLELQSKLLRVLAEGEFQRLGATKETSVDVRVIAATNRDLRQEMDAGRFRSDLYYRLSVFVIESPPLRDRREDIRLLAEHFAARAAAAQGKPIQSIARTSVDRLLDYAWPGNVRELKNHVERAVILSRGGELQIHELQPGRRLHERSRGSSLRGELDGVERTRILDALEATGWKIKGAGHTAERLGLSPSTLRSRMKRLGIRRPGS